jgi:hypothetical protein
LTGDFCERAGGKGTDELGARPVFTAEANAGTWQALERIAYGIEAAKASRTRLVVSMTRAAISFSRRLNVASGSQLRLAQLDRVLGLSSRAKRLS